MHPSPLERRTVRRAFTLIEALLVLAIITALLGLALTAVARSRGAARQTGCLNQLRQFGVAFIAYRAGNNEFIPFADDSVDMPRGRLAPHDTLVSYLTVDLPRVTGPTQTDAGAPWRCPADPALAERYGASYRYAPWPVLAIVGEEGWKRVSMETADPRGPGYMHDTLAFHGPAKTQDDLQAAHGRNRLLGDGSARASD